MGDRIKLRGGANMKLRCRREQAHRGKGGAAREGRGGGGASSQQACKRNGASGHVVQGLGYKQRRFTREHHQKEGSDETGATLSCPGVGGPARCTRESRWALTTSELRDVKEGLELPSQFEGHSL